MSRFGGVGHRPCSYEQLDFVDVDASVVLERTEEVFRSMLPSYHALVLLRSGATRAHSPSNSVAKWIVSRAETSGVARQHRSMQEAGLPGGPPVALMQTKQAMCFVTMRVQQEGARHKPPQTAEARMVALAHSAWRILRSAIRTRLGRFRCDAPLYDAIGRLQGAEGPVLALLRVRRREVLDEAPMRVEGRLGPLP